MHSQFKLKKSIKSYFTPLFISTKLFPHYTTHIRLYVISTRILVYICLYWDISLSLVPNCMYTPDALLYLAKLNKQSLYYVAAPFTRYIVPTHTALQLTDTYFTCHVQPKHL